MDHYHRDFSGKSDLLRSLILGLCEGANFRSNPRPDSNPNPEVVKQLNACFCMELSRSLEIRKESMLMILVQIYPTMIT